jgi:hypothetical protein
MTNFRTGQFWRAGDGHDDERSPVHRHITIKGPHSTPSSMEAKYTYVNIYLVVDI